MLSEIVVALRESPKSDSEYILLISEILDSSWKLEVILCNKMH